MSTSVVAADQRVAGVEFSEDSLIVRLMDGRSISVPLAWYPRLLSAAAAQRAHWKIAGGGYGNPLVRHRRGSQHRRFIARRARAAKAELFCLTVFTPKSF